MYDNFDLKWILNHSLLSVDSYLTKTLISPILLTSTFFKNKQINKNN